MSDRIKLNIRIDDTVLLLTGKDKGKQGRVLGVDRERGKITVENINVSTQHKKKAGGQRGQSGIQKIPLPVDISNVKLVCPRCSKPSKIERVEVKGKRVRKCKACKELIDQV